MIQGIARNWLLKNVAEARGPDVKIGGFENPYMLRWHVLPRNRVFNVYLHLFLRSDDDRALHDHPWWSLSWLLDSFYYEEVPADPADPAGPRKTLHRRPGQFIFRKATDSHRIVLPVIEIDEHGKRFELACWTLFVTGPNFRKWGFWCPHSWRFWKDYHAEDEHGASIVGRGCD